MAATFDRAPDVRLHPLHAILLAFPVALFAGALLSDYAYWSSFEIQWANFAAWLIAVGLFFGAFVLLWALVELARGRAARRGRLTAYVLLLLAMCLIGFVNALIHARDAWATMPAGFILSAVVAVLALVAAWIGHSGFARREVRS